MSSTAPYWLEAGSQFFFVDTARNDSLYLNAANVSQAVFVQVNADITVELLKVVEDAQEEVGGSLTIVAQDTNSGLADILVMVYLYDGNGTQQSVLMPETGEDGKAVFVFEADPPYGDSSVWGEVTMDIVINDPASPRKAFKRSASGTMVLHPPINTKCSKRIHRGGLTSLFFCSQLLSPVVWFCTNASG